MTCSRSLSFVWLTFSTTDPHLRHPPWGNGFMLLTGITHLPTDHRPSHFVVHLIAHFVVFVSFSAPHHGPMKDTLTTIALSVAATVGVMKIGEQQKELTVERLIVTKELIVSDTGTPWEK